MDKTTFQDPDVLKALQRWFVPVRVTEKSSNLVWFKGKQVSEDDLLTLNQVSGFPTLMFLQPNGEELVKLPGYMAPEQMDSLLKFIGTKAYTKMDFETFKKNYVK